MEHLGVGGHFAQAMNFAGRGGENK